MGFGAYDCAEDCYEGSRFEWHFDGVVLGFGVGWRMGLWFVDVAGRSLLLVYFSLM